MQYFFWKYSIIFLFYVKIFGQIKKGSDGISYLTYLSTKYSKKQKFLAFFNKIFVFSRFQ